MGTVGLYNYSKLRGLIKERGKTQDEIAKSASLNSATLSQKLCGKGLFRQNEITAICNELGILPENIGLYFFAR